MSEVQRFTVAGTGARLRADKALAMAFPEHSRVAFQRAFDAGLVTLGGKALRRSATVASGDTLEFTLPDVVPSDLKPVKMRLDVLFEDRSMLALNKPSGLVVHPGAGTHEDTLVHALLAHCKGSLSGIGGVERPGIVHRLDRETSGVMIVAKTDAAHRALAEQFAERTVQKEYLAVVSGVPRLLSGSIRRNIGRNPRHRHKMAAVEDGSGREAWTDWEVVEHYGTQASLVRCILHTGRTHQIRVHMASLGHPLLGDATYGYRPPAHAWVNPLRVMLHAERLALAHPLSGKAMDLKAPLPADFKAVVRELKRAAKKAQQ